MARKAFQIAVYLSICTVVLFFCANPQNPFGNSGNARISLVFMDSKGGAGANLSVNDTVGNTIKVGVCPYLSGFIDSVVVTVFKYRNNIDSVYILKNLLSDVDTVWNSFTFTTVGKWNISAKAVIQGGRLYTLPGEIKISGKNVSASIQPLTETRVADSIAAFTVSSSADTPLTYQWYHDTATLAGEIGVSFIKSHITFSDSGRYTCRIIDKWGDTGIAATAAILVVTPKVRTNTKPLLSVSGHSTILSTEICSLTVSATDPDSGQTHVFAVVKAPAGYAITDSLFIWSPPSGYLGADTIKTDTAIFTVTDNGVPPLSDTQKMAIVVSLKIPPPDSVKGMAAISRINGSFVFKWNASKNADQYAIFRSKDTTGFVLLTTTTDTMFANAIKDTSFYYYVVATNSKGQSVPSSIVHSTAINTAPKWSHETINISINEGSSFSMNCADSCKDTNGDAISFSLIPGSPATDSLIGTTWKYSPSYTDSNLYTVKIKAWDGMDSSILTIMLHVVNVPRPPQPQPQNLSTNRGTALQIVLTATDPDGDAITSWTIDTQTTRGTTSIASSAQPNVTYTPTAGFIGTDFFTFKASVGSLMSTYSARVTIKVDTNNIAPKISTKLSAKTLNKGDSLVLTITINQDAFPAPWYYWYKAGALLDSTQVNSWKKTNLALADSGNYYVIVKNVAGQDSSGAKITMQTAPVISPKLSAAITVNAGSTTPVSVSVNADATPAPTYQWYFNATAIPGATANSYSKTWAIADTGLYQVNVSNAAGKDSSFTRLIVNVAPGAPTLKSPADGATNQPVSLILLWNKSTIAASYYVQVASDSNFVNMVTSDSTLTDTSKTISALPNETTYYWRVRAKNQVGSSPWSARRGFTIIVSLPGTPSILTPANGATGVSLNASFSWNAATGAASYSFQVSTVLDFSTGIVVDDSTQAPTVSKSVVLPSNNTLYYWRVRAKNVAGMSAWSSVGGFTTIAALPTISVQPISASANWHGTVSLNVSATPAGVTYAWYQKGNSTSKGSGSTLQLTNLVYSDSGKYYVVVSNIAGSVTSDTTAKVTVVDNVKPSITLKGAADTTILLNPSGTYTDPGLLSATDDRDGNVLGSATVTSVPVNLGTCGKYTVTWQDSDLTGNKNTASRTVKVMGWVAAPDIDVYAFQAVQTNDDNLYIGYNEPQFNNVFVNKYIANTNSWQQVGGQLGTGNVKMAVSWDKTAPCIATLGSGNIISVKKLNGTVWNSVNGSCETAPSWTFYSDLRMFSDGMPYIAMTAFHTMVLSVFKSDPTTQCWVGPYAQNNDYGVYSGAPALDINPLGQVYTIATSSSGNIVAYHDSLYWHQVGVNSVAGAAALSKIILDESPTPIPYIYGRDSVDYLSPMAWKLGGNGGWTSLGRVKDGETKQDCFAYSSSTKNFYAGYVDNTAGKVDSCYLKEFSGGAWQPFPKLTNGKVPVVSPAYSIRMFVFIGQSNYYVVYEKMGGKVGVLRYQVIQ